MKAPSFLGRDMWSRWASAQPHRRGKRAARARFAPGLDALEGRTLLSYMVTNTNDNGSGSLRQEIAMAPSGATITFAADLAGQTITLTSGVLAIGENLTIDGLGASKLAVSGGGASEVFSIAGGSTVTISGLTITDGLATSGEGGGISSAGTLVLDSCAVTDNQAGSFVAYGGGIFNTGSLTLNNSDVSGNEAIGDSAFAAGGGIENQPGATLTVNDSTILDNTSLGVASTSAKGGGIDNEGGGTVSLWGSTVSGNQAIGTSGQFAEPALGGAISDGGSLSITDSVVDDNRATGGSSSEFGAYAQGGAVAVTGRSDSGVLVPATLLMKNSVLSGNLADGGAVTGTGLFTEGGFAEGGGLFVNEGDVTLTGCTLSSNEALGALNYGTAAGGAIDSGSSTITITSCGFATNVAQAGAGATSPEFLLFGGDADGGAIISDNDQLTLTSTSFTSNQALGGNAGSPGEFASGGDALGGAVFATSATVANCSFIANQAIGGIGEGGQGGEAAAGALYLDLGSSSTICAKRFQPQQGDRRNRRHRRERRCRLRRRDRQHRPEPDHFRQYRQRESGDRRHCDPGR